MKAFDIISKSDKFRINQYTQELLCNVSIYDFFTIRVVSGWWFVRGWEIERHKHIRVMDSAERSITVSWNQLSLLPTT